MKKSKSFLFNPDNYLALNSGKELVVIGDLKKMTFYCLFLLLCADQLSYLFLDHAELLVHCLEVISEEAGPVEQLLEVPQRDLAHRAG